MDELMGSQRISLGSVAIQTDVHRDGRIEQAVSVGDQVVRHVLDTKEQHIRDALQLLGWTPPEKG